ncbi:MAG: hypothetical protein P9M12_05260, partial [Candidatus Aceula lacicola]|nr:hypothetical protein [Candidatus Aceula lacicola]
TIQGELNLKFKLKGNEPVERIFDSFDNDGNLTAQTGWAINFGERTLINEDNSRIHFDLLKWIKTGGELVRTFGIDRSRAKENMEIRIKFDEEVFEIKHDDGANTYVANAIDATTYKVIQKVSTSESVLFIDLPLEWQSKIIAKIVSIKSIFPTALMPDAHQDLIWAKITSIGPNGEKLDSSYQAFSDDEQPLIKISNGLADIVFDIGTRRYSLRYDLVHENLWQYPLSLSYQIDLEGREALIIDFYKKPVAFIERRDLADKLLEGKWHIRTKGDAVNVLFNPANLPSVINFVNSITLSGNTFNLPQGLRVERKEKLEYFDANGYAAALLKVFEIPVLSSTKYVLNSNGVLTEQEIGKGSLEEIQWADQLIRSRNTVSFYGRDDNKFLGKISRKLWRNFKGDVVMQQEQDGTTTYIFNFNHHNIGAKSFSTGLADDGTAVVNRNSYYLGRTKEGLFSFITIEGVSELRNAQGQVISGNGALETNYNLFKNADIYAKGIKNISIQLKDGEGRLRSTLSDYKGYIPGLVENLRTYASPEILNGAGQNIFNEFNEITFVYQNGDITTAYDAGSLHLGYGKRAFSTEIKKNADNNIIIDRNSYTEKGYVSKTTQLNIVRVGGTDDASIIRFVYDVEDLREANKSLVERALDPVGRLAWEVHQDNKPFRRMKIRMEYDPVYGVAKETYQMGWWKTGWGNKTKLIYKHIVALETGEELGQWWIWDVEVDSDGNPKEGTVNEFVDGNQADLSKGRVLFKSHDEAAILGERNGKHFYLSNFEFEVNNKFVPIEWKGYKEKGINKIIEYFKIHFEKHSENSAWKNLFFRSSENGALSIFSIVLVFGLIALTLSLPLLLLGSTKLLSKHFKKLGKSNVFKSKPDKNSEDFDEEKQRIRQRAAHINRHSCLVGNDLPGKESFNQYLMELYSVDPLELVNRYYSQGHDQRNEVLEDMKNYDLNNLERKYAFIEKYFIGPISYLVFAIMIDQAEKSGLDMKGKRSAALKKMIKANKWEEEYFVLTDRDIRRLFTFAKEQNKDPLVDSEFNPSVRLSDYLSSTKRRVLEHKGHILAVEAKCKKDMDKKGADKEALRRKVEEKKTAIYQEIADILGCSVEEAKNLEDPVENLIHPLRQWLKKQYSERKWKQPTFPVKLQKIAENKVLQVAAFAVSAVFGLLVFKAGIPVFGAIFIGLVSWITLHEAIALTPFLKFHFVDWFRAISKIIASRNNYKGTLTEEQIKLKKHFFKTYFKYVFIYSAIILFLGGFYSWGTIPLFGLILAGLPIILITIRESLRSWWYIFVESAAVSIQKNQKMNTLRDYPSIGKKELARMRRIAYLKNGYLKVLIEDTLFKFYLMTRDERAALRQVAENKNIDLLPEIGNPQAREEIVKFFDKIETVIEMSGGEKEFKKRIKRKAGVSIFKGTGKKRIIPSRAFLDGEEMKETTRTKRAPGLIKSGFTMFKEAFSHSWRIYLDSNLLQSLDAQERATFIEKLSNPKMSLKETIDEVAKKLHRDVLSVEKDIIGDWILYRADGYLKTLLFAEQAGESAYEVYVENYLTEELGRTPTENEVKEEVEKFLMFVHVHEDIDPDKENFGGVEPETLINEMVKDRGYVLNQPGRKVIVSTKDSQNGDGAYQYPKEQSARWIVKTDKWAITARFIEQFLLDQKRDDATIVNLDRDHFFFPADFFFLPVLTQLFEDNKKLGGLTIPLSVAVDYVSNTAADHKVAEDNFNTRVLLAEAEIGAHAFYGPGIVRWSVMRQWGAYMSNIEDTAAAHEALMMGYSMMHCPWVSIKRPREMLMVSILDFQNRFGGLVLDEFLTTHFQAVMDSDQIHWTQKLTLFENFDFYFNKPLIPRYNLLIFLFSLFLSFSPFAPLAFPLLFVTLQYIFAQGITAGGVRLFTSKPKVGDKTTRILSKIKSQILRDALNTTIGYFLYVQRLWSLAFTFIPLIPMHSEKVMNAFKGKAGVFTSGVKDIVYPLEPFEELFEAYKPAIGWGILLLTILLFAPIHPITTLFQIFFFIFPITFIFGPFMNNGHKILWISRSMLLSFAAALVLPLFVSGTLFTVFGIAVTGGVLAAGLGLGFLVVGLAKKEKLSRALFHGLLSIVYFPLSYIFPLSFRLKAIDAVSNVFSKKQKETKKEAKEEKGEASKKVEKKGSSSVGSKVSSSVSKAKIDKISSNIPALSEIVEKLRDTDLREIISNKKFALYSGPPGGGKGEIWLRFQERYNDIISKFVLFHTRPIRPG